ncbi:DUF5689 domain-containing protein [Ancylomarina sp.]|uniref:DUF5689 domain-containing protein n=1 Tax=Ancylomarina sp. TaxID=1970196 RepID=UPI003565457A
MKNISLSIIVALFGLLFLNSCIDDDYADPTLVEPAFEMPADANLISIDELKAIYTNTIPSTGKYLKADEFLTVEEDVYISGYVISDDKEGNFYKNIVIQGDLEGNSQGINISVGESSLFTSYAQGQKIFVKCKGLTLGKYGNEVQLGGSYVFYKYRDQDKMKEYRLSPIPTPSIDFHIFKDKYPVEINAAIRTIAEVDGSNDYKFTLITFENVSFSSPGETWGVIGDLHNPAFPFKTTVNMVDSNGRNLPLFTSNYSKFAHEIIPEGFFNVSGVLSYHNGAAQFVINRMSDVEMIGAGYEYDFKLDFTSHAQSVNFEKTDWLNYDEKGSHTWFVQKDKFSENIYASCSNYNTGDAEMISWLVTPQIDASTQKYFALSTAQHHWAHDDESPIEILYSEDFDGSNVEAATWKTLGVSNKAVKDTKAYNFVNSEDVELPLLGKIHIAIKYNGTTTKTTGYLVDNIRVFKK